MRKSNARGGADDIVVSTTGFEGYEGGLDQASASYLSNKAKHFEIDGRPAIYTPQGGEAAPSRLADPPPPAAEVVAVRGDDLAVRVRARNLTRKQLAAVVRRVHPATSHLTAPTIDPPEGYLVVGSVDAEMMGGLDPSLFPPDRTPGTPREHTVVWSAPRGASTNTLALYAMPARAIDLDALSGFELANNDRNLSVHVSAPANGTVVVEALTTFEVSPGQFANHLDRAVFMKATWGDGLMAVASGSEPASVDELLALLRGTTRADTARWDRLVSSVGR